MQATFEHLALNLQGKHLFDESLEGDPKNWPVGNNEDTSGSMYKNSCGDENSNFWANRDPLIKLFHFHSAGIAVTVIQTGKEISGFHLRDMGGRSLVSNKHLQAAVWALNNSYKLQSLTLSFSYLDGIPVIERLQKYHLPTLKWLSLSGLKYANNSWMDKLAAYLNCDHHICTLELKETGPFTSALISSLRENERLQELTLQKIEEDGLALIDLISFLFKNRHLKGLHLLSLTFQFSSTTGSSQAIAIFDDMWQELDKNVTLSSFSFSYNGKVGDFNAWKIMKAAHSVTSLVLASLNIWARGMKRMTNCCLKNTSLNTLDLNYNNIGNGIVDLAEILKKNTTIQCLELNGNAITGKGISALSESLEVNTTLKRLSLAGNPFDSFLVKKLTQGLRQNESLGFLDLSFCCLSEKGCRLLEHLVLSHNSLTTLNLVGNDIGSSFDGLICTHNDTKNDKSTNKSNLLSVYVAKNFQKKDLYQILQKKRYIIWKVYNQPIYTIANISLIKRHITLISSFAAFGFGSLYSSPFDSTADWDYPLLSYNSLDNKECSYAFHVIRNTVRYKIRKATASFKAAYVAIIIEKILTKRKLFKKEKLSPELYKRISKYLNLSSFFNYFVQANFIFSSIEISNL